jgi:L-seryl-tRNA(Ser) seleniumtransferase
MPVVATSSEPAARRPPSVERVRAALAAAGVDDRAPEATLAVVRAVIDAERARLRADPQAAPRSVAALAGSAAQRLAAVGESWRADAIGAINATGVLIHTNLGRATWPGAAIRAAELAAGAPLLLELDAVSGRRGPRYRAAEELLIELTGAEDALVTNNNAAAVALAVGLAGRGGGVVVSRGELVEIGGGVRIPEVVRRAGARLMEVGTTNRTRAADFAEALASGRAKAVLRVHRSNFRQEGFVEDADLEAVASLAHEHGAIVIDDLGSGALLDTAQFGLPHEPVPRERLAAGADLVTFSGDKLVGGPQAGLVVGRADLIERLRRDPLARAMRPDKVTLAAVAATLAIYRAGRATVEIPLWQSVGRSLAELEARASALAAAVGGTAPPTEATFGGGALPGVAVPSAGVAIAPPGSRLVGGGRAPRDAAGSADRLARSLRTGHPPVVGRIADGRVVLDLRTVEPERDVELAAAVRAAIEATAPARG